MAMRNTKGWLRILEIVLAGALIFSFLIFISQTQTSSMPSHPKWSTAILKNYAQDIFRTLDYKDVNSDYLSDLRELVVIGDWPEVNNEIQGILPSNVGYTLYQYSKGNLVYRCGTSPADIPGNKELVTTYYILSGEYGQYCLNNQQCALVLVLWFKQ